MNNLEKSRCSPINQTQKEMLIEFLKKNEKLQSGKFTGDFTFKNARELWEKISASLNSVPGGAKKDWKQWRKTWQDLKKNVKTKVVREKTYSVGTGGGPSGMIKLDDTENSILDMVSPEVTFGDTAVKLPEVIFEYIEDEKGTRCSTPNIDNAVTHESILLAESDVSIIKGVEKTFTNEDHEYHLKAMNKPLSKVTKTRRLENSLKISQQLVKIEEEKKSVVENFYEEKIKYMNHRQEYEKGKLQALQRANSLHVEILKEFKMLRQHFLQE